MVKKIILLLIGFVALACYNPEDGVTEIRNIEINFLKNQDSILADGVTTYPIEIKVPGIKFGEPKKIVLTTGWGLWQNDSTSIERVVSYNNDIGAYYDIVNLKATRKTGPFLIEVHENLNSKSNIDLNAIPNYPSSVQILADSISLKLKPSNLTTIKALFFKESGLISDDIKFRFLTNADVKIFPKEVLIDSSETTATLQLLLESRIDTIEIFGEVPALGISQPQIDTLRIAIIN